MEILELQIAATFALLIGHFATILRDRLTRPVGPAY
jgi:hypothetical protein